MALRAMPNTPPPPIRLKGTREVDKRGGMDGPDRLGIRWVRPAGFHLTLKFLGNVTQERLSGIVEVIGKVGPSIPPFMVSVSGVGVFPNARDPRVIWIGVRSVGEDLVRLQEGIEEGLEPLGFAREGRSFHPHFTLGRLKSFGGTRRQVDTFDGAWFDFATILSLSKERRRSVSTLSKLRPLGRRVEGLTPDPPERPW